MSIFPDDVQEAVSKIGSDWVKAEEFDRGLTVQLAEPVVKVRATNPKYGAAETDWLVKQEILEKGETFHYVFKDMDGNERKLDSKSTPLFLGFKQCEDLDVGDWIRITRSGKTDQTRYEVVKLEGKPVGATKPKEPEPVFNPEDIPF